MRVVLVTGALGQIGSELTPSLRRRSGVETVVATDVDSPDSPPTPYERVDVTDRGQLETVVERHDVDTVYHLAALLSATAERRPHAAYEVNVAGLRNVLEVARTTGVERVVVPSSIAVFGEHTPPNPAERTVLFPSTIYGISKAFFEMLGEYYADSFGLDVRGVRLPGVVSHETLPGGGTTDYAVEAFYEALSSGAYTYFVREDTRLPFVYMPDAIDALIGVAAADRSSLSSPCSYNVEGCSFTAGELTAAIREHVPDFEATYDPDDRQRVADQWPDTVDDSAAREEWGWEPAYSLESMTADMIEHLSEHQVA